MRVVKRSAFTLVELLVVISIIGMLMALLLPAVQAARETGRGNTCRNNIRNLVIAAYQYENRKGHYAGFTEYADNSAGTNNYWRPMMYNLWQDLERNDLYELYSRDTAPGSGLPPPAGISPPPTLPYLELLVCPSNPIRTGTPSAYTWNLNAWAPNGESGPYSVQNWCGLIWFNASGTGSGNITGGVPVNFNNNSAYIGAHDGSATTILVSENLDNNGSYAIGNINSATLWGRFFHWGDYNTNQQRDFYKINPVANKGVGFQGVRSCRPTSNHPQSVNVAFADIHVRTMRDSIAYRVYAHLCTPWGRQQQNSGFGAAGYQFVNVWSNALSESDF